MKGPLRVVSRLLRTGKILKIFTPASSPYHEGAKRHNQEPSWRQRWISDQKWDAFQEKSWWLFNVGISLTISRFIITLPPYTINFVTALASEEPILIESMLLFGTFASYCWTFSYQLQDYWQGRELDYEYKQHLLEVSPQLQKEIEGGREERIKKQEKNPTSKGYLELSKHVIKAWVFELFYEMMIYIHIEDPFCTGIMMISFLITFPLLVADRIKVINQRAVERAEIDIIKEALEKGKTGQENILGVNDLKKEGENQEQGPNTALGKPKLQPLVQPGFIRASKDVLWDDLCWYEKKVAAMREEQELVMAQKGR